MGRKVRIESEDGILTIRTAPIFQATQRAEVVADQ